MLPSELVAPEILARFQENLLKIKSESIDFSDSCLGAGWVRLPLSSCMYHFEMNRCRAGRSLIGFKYMVISLPLSVLTDDFAKLIHHSSQC